MILVVNSPKSISLINDPTWFLISLFCIIMIFLIMKKYLKSDKKILISVLILVISAYLLQILILILFLVFLQHVSDYYSFIWDIFSKRII